MNRIAHLHRIGGEWFQLDLSGAELAHLNGAAFLLALWPFETRAGREIRATVSPSDAERFRDELSQTMIRLFRDRGLWDVPWTPEVMARRAEASFRLTLLVRQACLAVAALRAAVAELGDAWDELCVVAPGGLERYGLKPADLLSMADVLEPVAAFEPEGAR